MWKILTAELHYNRVAATVFLLIVTLNFIAALTNALTVSIEFQSGKIIFSPLATIGDYDDSFYPFIANSAITFAITMIIVGMQSDKLQRANQLLPVPQRNFSLSRLLFVHSMSFVIVFFGIILFFAKRDISSDPAIWSLFSLNSLALSGVMALYVLHDLGYYEQRHFKWAGYAFVALLIITLNVFLNIGGARALWKALTDFLRSPGGALFFMLIWLFMAAFSRKVYERRQSYLA